MKPTWNRGLGVLVLAVAGGAGALGTDAAFASPDRQQLAQPVAAVGHPAIAGVGEVKSLRVETARLRQHVAQVARAAKAAKVAKVKARPRTPRQLGRTLAAARGWGATQFACL